MSARLLFIIALEIISIHSSYNLTWKYAPNNLTSAYGQACVATAILNDREIVYIIGGQNAGYVNKILYINESLHVNNVTILNRNKMPNVVCATQSTFYNPNDGIIYLTSGYESKGVIYKIYIPNSKYPSQITWSTNTIQINPNGNGFSCSALDVKRNIIITFGGQDRSQIWILPLNDIFPEWIANKTAAPYNISNHACILSQNKYWSFGGSVNGHDYSAFVLSYDIINDEWSTDHYPLYSGFMSAKAIEIDTKYGLILIAGGWIYANQLTSVMPQIYNISNNGPTLFQPIVDGLQGGFRRSMLALFMGRALMMSGCKTRDYPQFNCSYTNTIQISNLLISDNEDAVTISPTRSPSMLPTDMNHTLYSNVNTSSLPYDSDKNKSNVSVIDIVIIMIAVMVVIIISFGMYRWCKKRNTGNMEIVNSYDLFEGNPECGAPLELNSYLSVADSNSTEYHRG